MKAHSRSVRLAAIILCLVTCLVLTLVAFMVVSFPAVALPAVGLPAQGQSPQPGAAAPSAGEQPQPSAGAASMVRQAWQMAKDVGVYHFATDLAQTTFPAPSVANIGRSAQVDSLHLDGDVQLAQDAMSLRMWQESGPAGASKAEMRVEKGRGYVRQPDGTWQEASDSVTGLGTGGDPLGYLRSIKNVVALGTETHALPAPESSDPAAAPQPSSVTVSRYSFDFDGPAFAVYMRDELARQLTARGELPLDVSLDTAREYREMTGQGEVWVDARGLPLRLAVHLVYPEDQRGQRVEADIKTDFSGYPAAAVAALSAQQSPIARTAARTAAGLQRQLSRAAWPDAGSKAVIIIAGAGRGGARHCRPPLAPCLPGSGGGRHRVHGHLAAAEGGARRRLLSAHR